MCTGLTLLGVKREEVGGVEATLVDVLAVGTVGLFVLVVTTGATGFVSRVEGLAVPLTTSDILFSNTSPVVVLF